ncbi:hypothetical protein [Salinimicrobium oceani]|uniref:Uncharacterized protein n=1 Tax=Salinimicrobium oceani TaxID=2722702 RepID=A0ABX1D0K0_9FLAO|nr:hypothetical protein [Salinimicrobium oceani]NJW53820.1 hypothetical protein [Salinimicrobium oceani]
MKTEQEYIKDLSEIRAMMERTSKFMSLSGLSGIMAGVYALVGAYVVYRLSYSTEEGLENTLNGKILFGDAAEILLLALAVLVLALGTAVLLSWQKSRKSGEKLWNSAARRLAFNMAIPLLAGGIIMFIFFFRGLEEFIAPVTLVFYGMALFNASKFTFAELRSLALLEIVLGLISFYFTDYGLLLWALGFGLLHILYGIYMHLKYEK